jgi:hypothetical protein
VLQFIAFLSIFWTPVTPNAQVASNVFMLAGRLIQTHQQIT